MSRFSSISFVLLSVVCLSLTLGVYESVMKVNTTSHSQIRPNVDPSNLTVPIRTAISDASNGLDGNHIGEYHDVTGIG